MATLRQIVPTAVPLWAVFADEDGEPVFAAVACVGILADEKRQLVAGFCVGEHLEPADHKPHFVGYADQWDPDPWRGRCAQKRQALREAARKQAIVIPDVSKPAEWQ